MPVIYKKDRDDESDGYSDDSGMDSKDGMAKGDSDDSPSALIPKSILQGAKVSKGDKVILEVVHIYEDEVEVKYGRKDKEKKEKEKRDDGNDKRDEESAGSQMEMSDKQLSGLMDE